MGLALGQERSTDSYYDRELAILPPREDSNPENIAPS